jgi:iron-sulfur cluster repair protein YtfE (RIC family)
MSIKTTKDFLAVHAELRVHVGDFLVVAHDLPRLDSDERIEVLERTVVFLADMLLPHALVEERVLFPEACRLIGGHDESGQVARDRSDVRAVIREIVDADPRDVGRLQEILYSLYLMLSFHLQREEDLYMRLVRSHKERGVRRLLDHVGQERYEQSGRRFARRTRPGAVRERAPFSVGH